MSNIISPSLEEFKNKSAEEKTKYLLQIIAQKVNGEVSNCPCSSSPQLPQERLAEIFKSAKDIEGTTEIDLENEKISSYEEKGDGTKKETKYRPTGTNLYIVYENTSCSAVFGDEYLPLKFRSGKDNGKDILVGRLQYEKGKYVYFVPDICISMSLIGRVKGVKDAVYLMVYDRSHGAFDKCALVALPDCSAPFNLIEFIKTLTKALASQKGEVLHD